jgi:hypothetical protein
MNEESLFDLMKDWGYYTLETPHPGSPGYTGLVVAIRKQPTAKHFDPETVHLCRRDDYGLPKGTTLSLISPLAEEAGTVCPGIIRLRDRIGKEVDFYTFGGSLETAVRPGEMVVVVRSPAPILELTDKEETVQDELAAETGALLGRVEINWLEDEKGFSHRLASVDPLQLYVATVNSLLQQFEEDPTLAQGCEAPLYQVIQRERDWLISQDQWPENSPSVEELFSHS